MEIIAVLIGFLLFVLILLSIPVDLGFYLKKDEVLEYRAELCLLFGLVTIDMAKQNQKTRKSTLPKKKKKEKNLHLVSLRESKRFIKRLMRLVRDLFHDLQIKDLRMHWHFGLGDPADTGMLLGLLQPMLLPWENATLSADFQEAVLEGYCKAEVRIFPIRILGYILAFIFSGATIRVIKNALIK
ncbi:hypothetical protein PF327_07660 [Sulfurovum sp. XTW-4]|uniref:DUF2953 domain-containing protein n=1 Tax=Sulfurovum xiamenensis TaxID=3019066 RepID=A0ABT7QSL5_9BACT|nr:hypothetical protein [Sulfurovum xiamenensis]MDM5264069.1 hypothetical protein [Sulfurovum xiamenensis]